MRTLHRHDGRRRRTIGPPLFPRILAGVHLPGPALVKIIAAVLLQVWLGIVSVPAQELPSDQEIPRAELRPESVVANVGNEQILWADVQFQLQLTLGDRQLEPQARQVATAAAVQQLVNQLIVSDYLQGKRGYHVSDSTLQASLERLGAELARTDTTIESMLAERGESMNHLRQQMRWQAGWDRYLKNYLNRENLQKYFDQRKNQFDGTRVRVAHILLAPIADAADREQDLAAKIQAATELRSRIVADTISWDEAVQQHSAASDNDPSGDLGWIERDKPMPEVFAAAAFELDADQISPPVVTPFGVHLIRCLEIEPGKLTLRDVEPEVRAAATKYLFEFLLEEHRSQVQVRISRRIPHFDPESGQWVPADDK